MLSQALAGEEEHQMSSRRAHAHARAGNCTAEMLEERAEAGKTGRSNELGQSHDILRMTEAVSIANMAGASVLCTLQSGKPIRFGETDHNGIGPSPAALMGAKITMPLQGTPMIR